MKKVLILLVMILAIAFTGCMNSQKEDKNVIRIENIISDLVMLQSNETERKVVSGGVLSGIYLHEDGEMKYYSIDLLADIAGDQNKIMELILVINNSDMQNSYVVYSSKAVLLGEYSSAGDFNDPGKSNDANTVIGVNTIVLDKESGEKVFADGSEIKVIETIAVTGLREIFGIGYEITVRVTVNDLLPVDRIVIEKTSGDIPINNLVGEATLLIDASEIESNEAILHAMNGDEVVETRIYVFDDTGNDTEAPTTPPDFTAVAVSDSQVDLSWGVSTDNNGMVGYAVYRDDQLISGGLIFSYSDKNLVPGTYVYKVCAIDLAGNQSEFTESISITLE